MGTSKTFLVLLRNTHGQETSAFIGVRSIMEGHQGLVVTRHRAPVVQENVESPSLKVFKIHVEVAPEDRVKAEHLADGWT